MEPTGYGREPSLVMEGVGSTGGLLSSREQVSECKELSLDLGDVLVSAEHSLTGLEPRACSQSLGSMCILFLAWPHSSHLGNSDRRSTVSVRRAGSSGGRSVGCSMSSLSVPPLPL